MATTPGDKPKIIIKIKKVGHGGHHGGAWKVAYADFVTAMMALFIVLWLLTQADLQMRSQIAQYFRSPGILPGGSVVSPQANEVKSREPRVVGKDIFLLQGRSAKQERTGGRGDGEQKRLEQQAKAVQDAIEQGARENPEIAALKDQVIIQVTEAGLSIQVVDKNRDALFDLSSAELKPQLIALLKRVALVLSVLPNPIQVGGHTDSRPYPPESSKTNWELSFERANNARRVLEGNGIRSGQVTRVIAYADSQPLLPANPLADENRRLSILAERQVETAAGSAPAEDSPEVLPGKLVDLPGRLAALPPSQ